MPDTLTSDLNRERDIVDRGTDGKTGLALSGQTRAA